MPHCSYLKSNLLSNAWWHNPRPGDASLAGMQITQSRTSLLTCSANSVLEHRLWRAGHGYLVRNLYPVIAVTTCWLHTNCADTWQTLQILFNSIAGDQQISLAHASKHFRLLPLQIKRCQTDTEIWAEHFWGTVLALPCTFLVNFETGSIHSNFQTSQTVFQHRVCTGHGYLVRNLYPVIAVTTCWLHTNCADTWQTLQILFNSIAGDQQISLAHASKHFRLLPLQIKRCQTDTEIWAEHFWGTVLALQKSSAFLTCEVGGLRS